MTNSNPDRSPNPSPSPEQIEALRAALDAFTRRFKLVGPVVSSEKSLNQVDIQTLLYVAQHPSCSPSEVTRFLGVAATTMSSATDRLARRGLLDRKRPESDRRAVALTLSDEGRAHSVMLIEAQNYLCRTMLERLAEDEQTVLLRLINKVVSSES